MLAARLLSSRAVANVGKKSMVAKKLFEISRLSQAAGMPRFTSNFNSRSASSGVQQELVSALQEQIESENNTVADSGASSPPTIAGFEISSNGAEVCLRKTHGNEKLVVSFNVNHSIGMNGSGYDDEELESDEAEVPLAMPTFNLEVIKGDQRMCFEMELIEAEDNQYSFEVAEFYMASAKKTDNEKVGAEVYASTGKFIDPSLYHLLFERYLEERGITNDFCGQLVNYATYYEHSQYVNLLGKIKNFVSA